MSSLQRSGFTVYCFFGDTRKRGTGYLYRCLRLSSIGIQ